MRTQRGKRLYLYLEDREHLFELAQGYHDKGPQEFFKALESLYVSEMIESVRTRVKVGGTDEPLTFRELGEGEQQLLMVLGLLRFMEGQEALFLLDEPDTHLNPAWSLRYAQLLRDSVADEETSQIVMATHDPLVIAGLERKDVLLMQRDDVTGRVFAEHPAEDPRGMGVAGLLTSEVYGLQSDLSPEAVADLETLRRLTMLGERTEEEERELSRIYKQYHGARLTRTTRDPMFSLFVQAMRKAERTENLDKLALSPTEVHERERLAVQIAQRVKAEYNARLDKDAGDSSVADE
jgi:ABC-type multidrug transport system ATPase subunit